MIRVLLVGLLASAATITGEIGARQALEFGQRYAATATKRTTETRKTHELNVPRIKDGVIKGYAVMMLSYTVDVNALKTAQLAPDSILVDEAFRYVYGDDTIDFDHLDRFDFAKMNKSLIHAVNARVQGDVLIDVSVQEFTYAPYAETHGKPSRLSPNNIRAGAGATSNGTFARRHRLRPRAPRPAMQTTSEYQAIVPAPAGGALAERALIWARSLRVLKAGSSTPPYRAHFTAQAMTALAFGSPSQWAPDMPSSVTVALAPAQ